MPRSKATAQVLSSVFAPAASVAAICMLTALVGARTVLEGVTWGLIGALFCSAIPMTIIHVAVRRDRLTDHHVTRRGQRWWVFLCCVVSVLGSLGLALLFSAPATLVWALITMIVGLAVVGIVTVVWTKASMHMFCLVVLILLAAAMISPWWIAALVVGVPMIGYARLALDHHSLAELATGAALAVGVTAAALPTMPTSFVQ